MVLKRLSKKVSDLLDLKVGIFLRFYSFTRLHLLSVPFLSLLLFNVFSWRVLNIGLIFRGPVKILLWVRSTHCSKKWTFTGARFNWFPLEG